MAVRRCSRYGRWALAAMALTLTGREAVGQEALRYSVTVRPPPDSENPYPGTMPYTFKAGDFRMLMAPSLGLSWNDNVYTARRDRKSDFILVPMMNFSMSYPLTAHNQLSLDAGVGYEKYFEHDDLSTWLLRSGSQLNFDAYIKDVRINIHDRFAYVRDTAREAAVANTAKYGNIENLAGLLVTWNLQDVVLSVGYDHLNVISPDAEFEYENRAAELFIGRAGFQLGPRLLAGVESGGSLTAYDQRVLNDNSAYSVGGYGNWQAGTSLLVQARAGYAGYQFDHTSRTMETGDVNSWYANLTVTHQPTAAISYSFTGGHEARLGAQADLVEDWYARPGVSWNLAKDWSLQSNLGYEHGRQGVGNISGNPTESYDWFGGDVALSYWIMKRLRAELGYRLTLRDSDIADRKYAQNLLHLNLTYQFR